MGSSVIGSVCGDKSIEGAAAAEKRLHQPAKGSGTVGAEDDTARTVSCNNRKHNTGYICQEVQDIPEQDTYLVVFVSATQC